MAWTNVNKPTGTNWTNDNFSGSEQYDDISVSYDDPNVYYDGINPAQWTNVNKPTTPTWNNIAKPT